MPRSPKVHRTLADFAPGRAAPVRSEAKRAADRRRPGRHARGYTNEWARASRAFLDEHPLCGRCLARGRRAASVVTDHRIPHRGDPVRFWDRSNWQALCKRCHDRKTATEDRGARLARVPAPPGLRDGLARARAGALLVSRRQS